MHWVFTDLLDISFNLLAYVLATAWYIYQPDLLGLSSVFNLKANFNYQITPEVALICSEFFGFVQGYYWYKIFRSAEYSHYNPAQPIAAKAEATNILSDTPLPPQCPPLLPI